MSDDPVVALLTQRLDEFKETLQRFEAKLDSGHFVQSGEYKARHEALSSRVARLEESRQWVLRVLGTQTIAIIASAVGAAVISQG